jgi:hypothetical protein
MSIKQKSNGFLNDTSPEREGRERGREKKET